MKKTKAHVRYKLEDGTRLPGVTTVIGLLAKPQLIAWANRLGLDGIDSSKYTDDLATVGTLAHEMVLAYFTGEKVDLQEYSPKDVERAENAIRSFNEWLKSHTVTPILNEVQLVSQALRVGGTVDMYCEIDGKKTLVDFKTSAALYEDHNYQLAAYWMLLEANGYPVEQAMLVRIGREASEGFEVRSFTVLTRQKRIFGKLLDLYYLLTSRGN